MSDDGTFKFNANDTGGSIVVSKEYPVFTTINLDQGFMLQALNEGREFPGYALAQKKGGTRTRLYLSTLGAWTPFLPTVPEQKKIAACLSSLDDLIAAEVQTLDTLKVYKKGLMQQLFPQEGEKVPRLRFPEFRGAGEWGTVQVGDLGEVVTGTTPSTTRPEFYGDDFMLVSPADISDRRYVAEAKTNLTVLGFAETRKIPTGSVLFVCIGSTIGKVAQNTSECATNQQINSVVPSAEYSGDFAYSLLEFHSETIAKLAGKQAVPLINKTTFSSVSLRCPSLPEQSRIASFLSSLDQRIAAQAQKIDALKTHKKGLMQGLFPVMPKDMA